MLLLLVAATLTGCASSLNQTPLDPKGPVAQTQTGLLTLSMWFALGIGTVVTVALLYVIIRFRERGDEQGVPKQVHGSTALEITWTAIPVIILILVGVPTVRANFSTATPPADTELTVRVTGKQWWFHFEYPQHGFAVGNELVIPVGEPVKIELTSEDVIHSFWVPKLAGKMDLIPGRTNVMWLKADEEGYYYGQCAEFCGASHAKMRFRVHAVSREEFDAWVQTRLAGAKEPTDPKAIAGKQLFMGEAKPGIACFSCHAIDGTKAQGTVGPNLSNIGDTKYRSTIAAGVLENTEENLKKWIMDPQSVKPGARMPAHKALLTEEELDQIVTYLRSLDR